MTKEQFLKAKKIECELSRIYEDIACWQKEEKTKAWLPHGNIPLQMFEDYKTACISEINKKKLELEKEFSEI